MPFFNSFKYITNEKKIVKLNKGNSMTWMDPPDIGLRLVKYQDVTAILQQLASPWPCNGNLQVVTVPHFFHQVQKNKDLEMTTCWQHCYVKVQEGLKILSYNETGVL